MGVVPSTTLQLDVEIHQRGEARQRRLEDAPSLPANVPGAMVTEAARLRDLRDAARGRRGGWRRLAVAGLGVLGLADSLYMLAYEEGAIDSMACPLFGEGCNQAGRAAQARHFGVPNAAVGAASYGLMSVLALWRGEGRRPWQWRALRGIAGAATAASAFLVWEQRAKVKAWCFWCLASAVINAGILGLSAGDPDA